MNLARLLALAATAAAPSFMLSAGAQATPGAITLTPIGQYALAESALEISAYDAATHRLFTINAAGNQLLILDLARPQRPTLVATVDLASFGGGVNSVAAHDGVLAVAVQADDRQQPGAVVFFDVDGELLSQVTVGALPDMVTFTPDGSRLLVANEGEPLDYCVAGTDNDPEGSVSIVDLGAGAALVTQADVATVGFSGFAAASLDPLIRLFGPGATVAQDLEPEYIALSADGTKAWVTLQENNAVAVIDVATATVSGLVPLGLKDHSLARNSLDASNEDGAIRIANWPVFGMYMPDGVASFEAGGATYLVTANEGDARDYECYGEEDRVSKVDLDPTAFPDAAFLQEDSELGRLKITTAQGDVDGDGDFDQLWSFGARSLSIWNAAGAQVWDSGNELELVLAGAQPGAFNNEGPGTDFDSRSDDKGPEPEGVVVGRFRGRNYAFVALERIGGIVVYDVTNPQRPFFVTYATNADAAGEPLVGTIADRGPEGILYVPRGDSPIDRALVIVSQEVSGTVTIYSVRPRA